MPSMADLQYDFYRGGSEEVTKAAFGVAGVSQAIGVDVAVITDPGIGKWKVWGHGRHTLADGLRLLVGTVQFQISSVGASNVYFGPYVILVPDASTDIVIELAVATGVSDTASATIYATKVADI